MKKLLIVVDYQNDFVDGSLGFDRAKEIESNIYKKILEYKNLGDDVLFTFDTHTDDYLNTNEGRNLPVPHCVKDTEGWSLYGSVRELFDDTVSFIHKASYGSTDLIGFLQNGNYDEIELIGLVTNICVISNAVIAQAALPEAEIIIDASCTAGNDRTLHDKALDVMAGLSMRITNREAEEK